jgi:hypothetical protein
MIDDRGLMIEEAEREGNNFPNQQPSEARQPFHHFFGPKGQSSIINHQSLWRLWIADC